MNIVKDILSNKRFSTDELIRLFNAAGDEKELIYKKAYEVKKKYSGNKVYLRALIEIGNQCKKDCFYCGIRKSNTNVVRYEIPESEIKTLISLALNDKYNSIVVQSGELTGKTFIQKITGIVEHTCKQKKGTGITLSCGEQSEKVYQTWRDAGANRYLLRIETSNRELYKKLNPNDSLHAFDNRLQALKDIQKTGYQTGTGIMIGLPFQTVEDLANDLLFMQEFDIDMCGMGPYIEQKDTPLYSFREQLLPLNKRADLTFLAIALLRIMMKDINIAATTALHTIHHKNIIKAINYGANVIMPNITPVEYTANYQLYKNKHSINSIDHELKTLTQLLTASDHIIDYENTGSSIHFLKKQVSK